jgi:hypothetical protein
MHDLLDRVVRHGNLHMSDEDGAGFLDSLRHRAARLMSVGDEEITLLSSGSTPLGPAPLLLAPRQGSKVIDLGCGLPGDHGPGWLLRPLPACCATPDRGEDQQHAQDGVHPRGGV